VLHAHAREKKIEEEEEEESSSLLLFMHARYIYFRI
jgi:hypothetical protein